MKQIVLLNEQKAYILETHLTTRGQKIKQKCTTKWGKTSKIETHLTTRRCQMKQKCTTNNMLQNVEIQKSDFSSNHVYEVWKKNQPLMSQTHSRPLETQAVYHSSGGFCAKSCKPLVLGRTSVKVKNQALYFCCILVGILALECSPIHLSCLQWLKYLFE